MYQAFNLRLSWRLTFKQQISANATFYAVQKDMRSKMPPLRNLQRPNTQIRYGQTAFLRIRMDIRAAKPPMTCWTWSLPGNCGFHERSGGALC